jgi:triacylglycerol lipase
MYPIMLCHGVCRFDILWKDTLHSDNNDDPDIDQYHYFKGIRTLLRRHGYEAWHTDVPWGAGVSARAQALARSVRAILERPPKPDKVHLVAHSMGGLDARHMLFDERNHGKIHERIASLTTISTPHHGSSFADWGTDHLPEVLHIAKALGMNLDAMRDLRTDRCRAFNQDPAVREFEERVAETIRFQTFAGWQQWHGVYWPLKIAHKIIQDKEGDNDGLVSVASAAWDEKYFQAAWPQTDHINELGWWDAGQLGAGEAAPALLRRIHDYYLGIAEGLR